MQQKLIFAMLIIMVHLPNNKKKWMSVISLRLERILGWFSMASFTVAHALIPHQIDNIDAQQNFSIYLLLYSVYLLVVYFFLLSFRPWFVHTSGGLVVYALAHLYMRFRSYTLYVSFSHSYHSWWIFFFFSSFALSPLLSLSLSFAIFLTLSLLWFIMHTYTRVLHAASTGTVCVCVAEYNLRWCANFCTEQYTTKDDICQMCSEKEMKIQMQSDEQWRIRILCWIWFIIWQRLICFVFPPLFFRTNKIHHGCSINVIETQSDFNLNTRIIFFSYW